MLKIVGSNQPPNHATQLQLSGICPHCKSGTRYNLATSPAGRVRVDSPPEVILGYNCDLCAGPVAVVWKINGYDHGNHPMLSDPKMIIRIREPFEFAHVADSVKKEIEEALDCLSVNGYNGFAAMCRRTIQAICTSFGAEGTTKVQAQINEMAKLGGLDEETKNIAKEIMLTGHDGSHPHLPDVNADRAAILLELLRDLVYQLFTRPGKIQESAKLRKTAIAQGK